MSSSRDLRPSRPSVSGEVDQVDTAEALFLDGAFEELEGGVAAILFDDEEVDAGLVAGLDHVDAVLPAGGHGLFGHDVEARRGGLRGLPRMEAARRGEDHAVRLRSGQHPGEIGVRAGARAGRGALAGRSVDVAHVDQLALRRVAGDRIEVV